MFSVGRDLSLENLIPWFFCVSQENRPLQPPRRTRNKRESRPCFAAIASRRDVAMMTLSGGA
jgi:hypothetical protein